LNVKPSKFNQPIFLAIVALGSNLGDSPRILREAMDQLQEFSKLPLVRSSLWETIPVDCPPGSPNFVNAVAILVPRPRETPESLLRKLQAMEKKHGRRPKKVMNEPRPLDLDLITFRNEVRKTDRLVLPHPRAHQRQFVLRPLNEILPHFILAEDESVRNLLARALRDELLQGQPPQIMQRLR
jgi:2-amino-4-hydroxy-6-hydroxymethyldihydropteridine diphosphokinase